METDHTDYIVCRLNADFTAAEGEYRYVYQNILPPWTREGIAHMERGGKHYIFSSGMTGYTPNPSEVAVSDQWMGPYTVLGDPHTDDPSRASFNSQISGIFKLADRDRYIAVADRWMPDALMTAGEVDVISRAIAARSDKSIRVTAREKLQMARRMTMQVDTSIADYVWLPIRFDGETPRIEWRERWTPDEL